MAADGVRPLWEVGMAWAGDTAPVPDAATHSEPLSTPPDQDQDAATI